MLRILIADDERRIRDGLKQALDAEEGFNVVYTASNGIEALSATGELKPDVVITDIRMPKMDGIELVKSLNNDYPGIKKIIISGYEDFGYVYETMKNGAIDYLLKPVDERELIALLRNIEAVILKEECSKKESMELQDKLRQSLPLLRDEFVRSLLCGGGMTEKEIAGRIEYLGMQAGEGDYCAVIINAGGYWISSPGPDADGVDLKACIARKLAEDTISKHASCLICGDGGNIVAIVAIGSADDKRCFDEQGFINTVAEDLLASLKGSVNGSLAICVGNIVPSLERIGESYENAKLVLKEKFYSEGDCILKYGDVPPPAKTMDKFALDNAAERFRNDFINAVEILKAESVEEILDNIKKLLMEYRVDTGEALKLLADLFTLIQTWNSEFKKEIDELYGAGYIYFKAIEQLGTLSEIIQYTNRLCADAIERIRTKRSRRDKRWVEIVKEYVDKNYFESITLSKISEMIYVNPNYFCEMFKNQTGESFVDYLTRVRIEKSKALLKDFRIKAYEVGAMVGYEDAGYFSKVFKKIVGVTPSEYRNLNV